VGASDAAALWAIDAARDVFVHHGHQNRTASQRPIDRRSRIKKFSVPADRDRRARSTRVSSRVAPCSPLARTVHTGIATSAIVAVAPLPFRTAVVAATGRRRKKKPIAACESDRVHKNVARDSIRHFTRALHARAIA
jgi:hypothetical protein